MTEGEQVSPQEARVENPVVGAARGAVRKALETNENFRNWRDNIKVKDRKPKSVYRAWMDAADRVVNNMTAADRGKLSTKMYEMKMRLAAATFGVVSPVLDLSVNVLSFIPRKAVAALGWVTMLGNVPTGLVFVGAAKAMDKIVDAGVTRVPGINLAEQHALKRTVRYKVAEAITVAKQGKDFVGQTAKNILTGFAYPDGKPQPEKPSFWKKTFGKK